MNALELKTVFAENDVKANRFEILRSIANLSNQGSDISAREMVLRALEHREQFGDMEPILDALVREAGLYPYMDDDHLSLSDQIAYEFHKPLNMEHELVFHRQQSEIYLRLMEGQNVILSAPTSFGKSRIIDAVIAAERFNNIVVIVPTIALIDETRRRLSAFSNRYKIVTQVSQEPESRNVFVFTAERANAYQNFPRIELLVVDEFYKIDALSEDKQRTVALNQAFYKFLKQGAQFYMLGPCIHQIPYGLEEQLKCTFYPTQFATVVSEEIRVNPGNDPIEALVRLCRTLGEPTLIFCKSPKRVNQIARALVTAGVGKNTSLEYASNWLGKEFHSDWILPVGLSRAIGIHHGRLPRSIGQFIVRGFNEERLQFLICTSTLIEGVNTKAKNVIIFDNEIAQQKFDYFTFNNIKGRSGRMFQHFIGRVFLFHAPPEDELRFVDFPLYSQGQDTPNSILVQLDDKDLTREAKRRVEQFRSQKLLPMEILKDQAIFEPEDRLSLAKAVAGLEPSEAQHLAWAGFPRYEDLEFCSELIWNSLVRRPHAGVRSSRQLALRLNKLSRNQSVRSRIAEELQPGPYKAESPDEAVERVLQFDRTWASFEVPRLFTALDAIQKYVLRERDLPPGNYKSYINRVENLFRKPFYIALEEYGLPLQVTDKLSLHNVHSIDEALEQIADYPVEQLTHQFERELLKDCIAHL